MKRFLIVLCLAYVSTFGLANAAPDRVALVIGNADYKRVGTLENPVNDASAMASTLRGLGFDVVEGLDLDRDDMQSALRRFLKLLKGAEVGLFYYAGHGVQVDGENHLIPVDAEIEGETDLALATVPLSLIRKKMSEAVRVKLIILDACRDNPFKSNMASTRAIGIPQGLAPVQLSDDVGGAFVAFATDPGAYAQDGLGRPHSPFTQALLDNLTKPGLELHAMMIDVRSHVWQATGETQRPWSNSSLTGKFYFSAPVEPEPVSEADLDLALWQAASAGNTAAEYTAYLTARPDGTFAGIARARLAGIAAQTAPIAAKGTLQNNETLARIDRPAEIDHNSFKTSPASTPARPSSARLTPRDIENIMALPALARQGIQKTLLKLGYDAGTPDGVFGEQTRTAIRSWQWGEEFPATGYLTAQQIRLMLQHAGTAQSAVLAAPQDVAPRATEPGQDQRSSKRRLSLEQKPALPVVLSKPIANPHADEDLLDEAWRHIGDNLQHAIDAPAPKAEYEAMLKRQRRSAIER